MALKAGFLESRVIYVKFSIAPGVKRMECHFYTLNGSRLTTYRLFDGALLESFISNTVESVHDLTWEELVR